MDHCAILYGAMAFDEDVDFDYQAAMEEEMLREAEADFLQMQAHATIGA